MRARLRLYIYVNHIYMCVCVEYRIKLEEDEVVEANSWPSQGAKPYPPLRSRIIYNLYQSWMVVLHHLNQRSIRSKRYILYTILVYVAAVSILE